MFTTAEDHQPAVTVHVLQGEREMAADNRTLGRFELAGIPPAPRGIPQIEVTFDIDADGILHVKAQDKATNKEQSIRITASSGLSKDEIDRMVGEAQSHAAEDRRHRELVDSRNRADSLIYQTERTLKEFGDKVAAEEKTKIDEAIGKLRSAVKGDEKSGIDIAIEELQKVSYKLAEEMYRQKQGEAGPAPGGTEATAGRSDSGDKVDADYQVIDEEDKKS